MKHAIVTTLVSTCVALLAVLGLYGAVQHHRITDVHRLCDDRGNGFYVCASTPLPDGWINLGNGTYVDPHAPIGTDGVANT